MKYQQLSKIGIKGLLYFYTKVLLVLLPIALACFSIYWAVITSEKIWKEAIGSNITVANAFQVIISMFSSGLLLFSFILEHSLITQLYYVITMCGLILCCAEFSLSTTKSAVRYNSDITDWCARHPGSNVAKSFLSNHLSQESIANYIFERTTQSAEYLVGFFVIWVALLLTHIFAYILLQSSNEEPLLDNSSTKE